MDQLHFETERLDRALGDLKSGKLHANQFARILQQALATADRVAAGTAADAALTNRNLIDMLSRSDLEEATAKAPFVREDCELLPLGDLVEQCRLALLGGNRATMFLYARYGRLRLLTIGVGDPAVNVGERESLSDSVEQMTTRMSDPAKAEKALVAQAARDAATRLHLHADRIRSQAATISRAS